METLSKTAGDKKHPKYVIDYIKGNKIDVVINVPEGTKRDEEVTIGCVIKDKGAAVAGGHDLSCRVVRLIGCSLAHICM